MSKKKTNKTLEVRKYLETHKKGITPDIAWKKFGSTRLADIIFHLRKNGMDILTIDEVGKDRYGNRTTWARYILQKSA